MQQPLVTVFVRLLGVYMILLAFGQISGLITAFRFDSASDAWNLRLVYVGAVSTYIGLGVALLYWSKKLARLLGNGLDLGKEETTSPDIVSGGTFLIGLFWVIDSLPSSLVNTIVHFLWVAEEENRKIPYDHLIDQWLTLLFALAVMLSTPRVAAFVRWLRIAGADKH